MFGTTWKAKVAVPSGGDVVERDDDFVSSLVLDPFGRMPDGGFFGGRLRNADDAATLYIPLGRGATPLILRVRHLPTERVMAAVEATYGDAGKSVMERWRAYWNRLTGDQVDRFAARILYFGPSPFPVPSSAWHTARRLRDGTAHFLDAKDMFEWRELARSRPARTSEAHALEDATFALALERDRVPVAYVSFVPWFRWRPMVVVQPGAPREVRRSWRWTATRVARDLSHAPEYWCAAAFLRTCSRTMVQALDAPHLAAILLDMARQGHAKAFLKHRRQKAGTWVVDLEGVSSVEDAMGAFARAVGLSALNGSLFTGQPAGMLVQEFTPFVVEHRFFVVRGRIVASTPSDRALTLLDAVKGPRRLDPRVARIKRPADSPGAFDRGDTSSETDRRLVAAMARKARRLLSTLRADRLSQAILGHAFVVDVGSTDETPEGVDLVEVNSFRNAGLYAVDVDKLSRSLKDVASWPEMPTKLDDPELLASRVFPPQAAFRILKAWMDVADAIPRPDGSGD